MRSEGYSTWSVCLSVKSHLTYGASVRPENAVTYSAGNEGQKNCGDLPKTTAFKGVTRVRLSPLDTQRSARG